MNEILKATDEEITKFLKSKGIGLNEFNSISSLTESFIEYSTNIDAKKINLGFFELDKAMRGLRTQELLTLVAPTGIGKSAIALNFLLNFVKQQNELTVLFSLEMSEVGIAERLFQIEFDLFGYHVEKNFIEKDEKFIQQCYDLNTSLNNLVIINKRIDIHSVPDYVNAVEKMKGRKVRLVCIDYVGLMKNKDFIMNEYARVTDNMTKLYSYAKELDVAVINLSQVSRADVKGNDTGLSLFSAKGSGEVENSSDFYLTLEKVIETNKTELDEKKIIDIIKFNGNLDLLKLTIHKNRRGKKMIIYVIFNRKNLRINEYNENWFIETYVKADQQQKVF